MKNKINAYELTVILTSLLVLLYVGYHIFLYFDNPYTTQYAVITDFSDEINMDGFFVRDEHVISGTSAEALKYNFDDGRKVAKGAVLASTYNSSSDLTDEIEYQKYKDQIAQLEEIQDEGTVKGLRVDTAAENLEKRQIQLIRSVKQSDFSDISDICSQLSSDMNKLAISKGSVKNFNKTVKSLEDKCKTLSKSISSGSAQNSVRADSNGYFSSYVDGYEQALSYDEIKDITYSQAEELLKEGEQLTPQTQSIGKIFTSEEWYYVGIFQTDEVMEMEKGDSINVLFQGLNDTKTQVEIVSFESSEVKDKQTGETAYQNVVIISSDLITEEFVNARFAKAKILFNEYTGIGIPKEAVRFKDNEKGVYILIGPALSFKKIDVVYEDEDIVISRLHDEMDYVSQYDEIILNSNSLLGLT